MMRLIKDFLIDFSALRCINFGDQTNDYLYYNVWEKWRAAKYFRDEDEYKFCIFDEMDICDRIEHLYSIDQEWLGLLSSPLSKIFDLLFPLFSKNQNNGGK